MTPQDPTKPQRPSLELTLAEQANEAIKSGVDPHAATEMLGRMLTHLKQHPDIAAHGADALASGVDPHAISAKLWEMTSADTPAPSPVERPGVLSRAVSQIGQGLTRLVTHPIDSAESMITAPLKSAYTLARASAENQAASDIGSIGGDPSSVERTVTPRQAGAAGLQTAANLILPTVFGPLASKIGNTGALALTGSAAGAAYNPDDPGAGAIAGGVLTPVIGKTISGATRLANIGTRTSRLTKRIAEATPVDEHALAQNKATEAATRANYGQAAAEGEAAGGTSSALRSALEHPTIKPYVEMVRGSSRFKNADDATVAREAYKQISRQRKGLIKRSNGPNGYDAKADLEAGDLADAAHVLKNATSAPSEVPRNPTTQEAIGDFNTAAGQGAGRRIGTSALIPQAEAAMAREGGETPSQASARMALEARTSRAPLDVVTPTPERTATVPGVMPTFPTAVSEHARMMGNRAAFNDAVDMTRRVASGRPVAANRLDTWSPAAWRDRISQMTPEQAQFALDATLGAAQPLIKPVFPSASAVAAGTAGGAIFGGGPGAAIGALGGYGASAGRAFTRNVTRLNRLSPIVDALDAAAGAPRARPLDPSRALQAAALLQAFATRPDTSDKRRNR